MDGPQSGGFNWIIVCIGFQQQKPDERHRHDANRLEQAVPAHIADAAQHGQASRRHPRGGGLSQRIRGHVSEQPGAEREAVLVHDNWWIGG